MLEPPRTPLWWCGSCRFEEVLCAYALGRVKVCRVLAHCDGVVRVGSLCLNHPELVLKHPTHLAISVMVGFLCAGVRVGSSRFDVVEPPGSSA